MAPGHAKAQASGDVLLGCSMKIIAGANTIVLRNLTPYVIRKGTDVRWRTDSPSGAYLTGKTTLGADLAAAATVNGPVRIGATCKAFFSPGPPDLLFPKSPSKLAPTAFVPVAYVMNASSRDADPSTVKFEVLRCLDSSVVTSGKAGPLAVPRGSTVGFVSLMLAAKPPKTYWRITIDVDKKVVESDESNNVWHNKSTCGN